MLTRLELKFKKGICGQVSLGTYIYFIPLLELIVNITTLLSPIVEKTA